jgi:hypothetical protein
MAKRYTQEEKEYMAKMAIKIIKELDKDYPSFKNYVWAAQSMMQGKDIANSTDQIVYDVLKSMK